MFTEKEKAQLNRLLQQSLESPSPQEFNELDWKQNLSHKNERLKEHLSAFSNHPGGGYLIFGVDDSGLPIGLSSHDAKLVAQKLGNIAREGLEPPIGIKALDIKYRDKTLTAIRIPESLEKPVRKKGSPLEQSFIRAGGQTRRMSSQELRIALIGSRSLRFEELPAAITKEAIEDLNTGFDFSEILRRLNRPSGPKDPTDFEFLHANKLLTRTENDFFPTNLGVFCAAKDLNRFHGYERFAIRVTHYTGSSKISARSDRFFNAGYTHSLDSLIGHIMGLLPHTEILKRATRVEVPIIPEVAVREIVCNAVIHRDYSKTGSYITVDVFDDRIEVTNPGGLLPNLKVDRLIDHPSEARNEVLADLMRKLNFCEERGHGIDKAVSATEFHGLPPIRFFSMIDYFTVTLYAPRKFKEMQKEERIDAVYQHACLNFVAQKKTTNATVRQRFQFDDNQTTKITRLFTEAIEAGKIKLANPKASPRDMHYVPYWSVLV